LVGSVGVLRQTSPMADWTPLRRVLADVTSSVTLPWAELDALVGGLPNSAYVHNAFWKGDRSGWPGFTTTSVRVGESVTFVRSGQTPSKEPGRRPTPPPVRNADSQPDILLIGCVKKKLAVPAAAKDLYTSPLFRKGRAYAERINVPWFILSAEHGLVRPDDELAPYNLRLSKTPREYRRAWGVRVVADLDTAAGGLTGKSIEVHAGSAYTDAIRPQLIERGAVVVEALAGLRLGPRLSWYGADPLNRPEPSPETAELVNRLRKSEMAIQPADFLATDGAGLRTPGLYSWWVDADGAVDLSRGLGQPLHPGLIYAGLAGATRANGRKSKNTLWGRIKTMHLGGRHEFSTFRLSLGSILAEASKAPEIDERALTDWMHAHLRLVAVPVADADTLGAVETEVLTDLNPPLNLDKVRRDPRRTQLSALRKKYGRKGRGPSTTSAG